MSNLLLELQIYWKLSAWKASLLAHIWRNKIWKREEVGDHLLSEFKRVMVTGTNYNRVLRKESREDPSPRKCAAWTNQPQVNSDRNSKNEELSTEIKKWPMSDWLFASYWQKNNFSHQGFLIRKSSGISVFGPSVSYLVRKSSFLERNLGVQKF